MRLTRCFCGAALLVATIPVNASDGTHDSWVIRVGVHDVDPKADNGQLAGGALTANVGSSVRPTAVLEYLFVPNVGVELLAAWPFEHDIRLNGTLADERGPLAGARLNLSNSFGFAAHVGLDFHLTDRWLAGVDLRWINIETDARVDGAKVGTVNVNPLVYGLYAGYRF